MRRNHALGILMLSIAGMMSAVAAAMEFGLPAGLFTSAIGVAFIGLIAYNTPQR